MRYITDEEPQYVGEKTNVSKPSEIVCIDIFGPLPQSRGGVVSILVICDLFSKFTRLYPLKNTTSTTIIKRLEEYIAETPQSVQTILSDNGRQFCSDLWAAHWQEKGIRIKHTSPYHPEAKRIRVNESCQLSQNFFVYVRTLNIRNGYAHST